MENMGYVGEAERQRKRARKDLATLRHLSLELVPKCIQIIYSHTINLISDDNKLRRFATTNMCTPHIKLHSYIHTHTNAHLLARL